MTGSVGADARDNALVSVRSADGTTIALEQVSSGGPHLLMVAGATNDRRAWAGVAGLLPQHFSCWLMDRRGKGDSTDTEPYGLDREYEDVAAAVSRFDQPVFLAAHSSGAICALGAVAGGLPLAGLVLYEPPWPVEGPNPGVDCLDQIERRIAYGDPEAALELALRVLVGASSKVIADVRASPIWAVRTSLVHTWPREVREIERLPRDLGMLGGISVPTLFLRGEVTAPWLARSTAALADAIASSSVVELAGQGHAALALAPHLVADAIRSWASPAS